MVFNVTLSSLIFFQNYFEAHNAPRFKVTDQEEERGKKILLRKEPEIISDKRHGKGIKGKKNYQTDFEGAGVYEDQEMKDDGG